LGSVDGVDGIKTGYTRASGYNLASSAVRDGRRIVAVVLGGETAAARDAQVAYLIEGAFEELTRRRALDPAGVSYATRPVQNVTAVVSTPQGNGWLAPQGTGWTTPPGAAASTSRRVAAPTGPLRGPFSSPRQQQAEQGDASSNEEEEPGGDTPIRQ
jgi:D-alanyl-D-alanine carboxypeptidase